MNKNSNDDIKMDNETKSQITIAISNLPVLIDNWLKARNAWTEKISCDANRELFIFSTSQALIDMGAEISTTLQ
jgi:hypothetical protein